jgi:hypothetical protein
MASDSSVKIDEGGVTPEDEAKIDKSVKGKDQAPTTAQQTPTQDQWTAMRDVLGPPFDSERVTLYQMRQMRKDAMIAFGLHYIKVPLARAEWHIEARDKDGPNAQVAAFIDAALRPIYTRLIFQRTLALDFGFQAMVKRFIMKNPGGVFNDTKEENPDNQIKPIWDEGSVEPIIWKTTVPLRPELVKPVFNDKSGDFDGMTYEAPQVQRTTAKSAGKGKQQGVMEIDVYHSLWGTNAKDDELGSIYGFPRTGHARDYWWAYKFLFQLSNRGYERVAVPPVIAFHPEGSSIIDEETGETRPNFEIALEMADRLRSNAVAAVPSTMAEAGLGEASTSQRAWDFKFLETPSEALRIFDARFNYLNVMKLRSVWVPEQAFIEGEGGTSSRNVAAQMAEIFVESQSLQMDEIDDEINRYMIPQLLIVNFPEFVNNGGVAFKVSHGFRKEDIEFYKQVLQLIGQSNASLLTEQLDITELLRRMNAPLRDPNDLQRERQQLAAQQALGGPPLVTPGPGNVGVIRNPQLNQGFTAGGSAPGVTANGAAAGFGEFIQPTIYIQPNEHYEILLADAEDFIANLPASKHYSDKTIRSLALQLRRVWESHFRRLYPSFAKYIAGVDTLELADEDRRRVRITKKTAQAAARKLWNKWGVDSEEMQKLAERSAELIRKIVNRAAKLDQRNTNIEADIDEDDFDAFVREQTGRLIKLTNQTFKDEMNDFLVESIREGQGPREIADNITAHFSGFSQTRADRVGRSETRDSVNAATLLSGQAAGIRYVRATDGEDFDEECRKRNGKLFTIREAWRELRKEHPNGTLAFDLIPRANFSIEYVDNMPEAAPAESVAYFDQDTSTAFLTVNSEETERYLIELGDWLVKQPSNGHMEIVNG